MSAIPIPSWIWCRPRRKPAGRVVSSFVGSGPPCRALGGYHRYWLAEHHNMPGIASAAGLGPDRPSGRCHQHTAAGAGGIMLPNHSPLVIAEQFGTLASLYRIVHRSGLGRARQHGINAPCRRCAASAAARWDDFPGGTCAS